MVERIDRLQLLEMRKDGDVQLVDVLPEPEYVASHIPGAINIPLRLLEASTVSHLSRDKPVVVY